MPGSVLRLWLAAAPDSLLEFLGSFLRIHPRLLARHEARFKPRLARHDQAQVAAIAATPARLQLVVAKNCPSAPARPTTAGVPAHPPLSSKHARTAPPSPYHNVQELRHAVSCAHPPATFPCAACHPQWVPPTRWHRPRLSCCLSTLLQPAAGPQQRSQSSERSHSTRRRPASQQGSVPCSVSQRSATCTPRRQPPRGKPKRQCRQRRCRQRPAPKHPCIYACVYKCMHAAPAI